MTTIICQHCGKQFESQRTTRKFCSRACSNRSEWVVTKTRQCRHCGVDFAVNGTKDANRQHCSRACAKNHAAKTVSTWQSENRDRRSIYRANQLTKDPEYERKRWHNRRGRILELLGGCCIVCQVSNPYWLHVDYIPTSRDLKYRHPRHFRYVSEHLEEFRILCANHHYELTLTGRIEGTGITQ
jgi:hypothetical protein